MSNITAITEAKKKAQDRFFQERIAKLSMTFFPTESFHPEFKATFHKLLKFCSQKQMGIHPKSWEQMCTFEREFFMPEMEVCLEVLKRTTPNELVDSSSVEFKQFAYEATENNSKSFDEIFLEYFNKVAYPKVLDILKPMQKVFNEIDKAVSIPLANKINSDMKISLQLPIGSAMNFVALPNHG